MKEIIAKSFEISDPIAINDYLLHKGLVQGKLINVRYNVKCEKCGRNCDIAEYDDHIEKMCDCNIKANVRTKSSKKIHYYWRISKIPENLKKSTFETFEKDLTDSIRNMYQGFKYYANSLDKDKPKTLSVLGSMGTGKTHLSISCGKELVKRGFSVYFISFPTLMRNIRETMDKGNDMTQTEIFKTIEKCDVFILDDIMVTSGTPYEINTLENIIEVRQGRANIYTSNLSNDDFSKNKNMQRIKSRLFDRTTTSVIKVVGDDYRTLPAF
ncbi:ATP-binding protein [Macrococcoides bohemicum]|uniref:IstB-like ATP-binding domain-containing protein n=1 Tax=Macrococcoides bohemicum TaxID=1903056 RepID=A0A328A7G9_9STAP|nr:ATP-binding protein [Macrococcus bohemicus]RAK50451.1 hypothetical protein BHX94_03005 [Macrococcus bohemicus]